MRAAVRGLPVPTTYNTSMTRRPYGSLLDRWVQKDGPQGEIVQPSGVLPTSSVATNAPLTNMSDALRVLYRRRDYARQLLQHSGDTQLADEQRQFQGEQGGLQQSAMDRGIYSTTVYDALRNRGNESHARRRAGIQEGIDTGKAQIDASLTGDIASQMSGESSEARHYAFLQAQANAAAKAAKKKSKGGLFGLLGGIAGTAIGGPVGGAIGAGLGSAIGGGDQGDPWGGAQSGYGIGKASGWSGVNWGQMFSNPNDSYSNFAGSNRPR